MRCPDCNKFVSYDEGTEPECDLDVAVEKTDDGTALRVTGTVRGVLACGDCGAELKEANFDVDVELSAPVGTTEATDVSVEMTSAEITSRLENKDRHGKLIKNHRYMKMMYGVEVQFRVVVGEEEATSDVDGEFKDELQASSWDELV